MAQMSISKLQWCKGNVSVILIESPFKVGASLQCKFKTTDVT